MTPWAGESIDERIEHLDKLIEVKEIQILKHKEERERLIAFKEAKNNKGFAGNIYADNDHLP